MYRVILLASILLCSTANAAPVAVDSSALGSGTEGRTGIGVTASSTTRPYVGIGSQMATLPYISWRSGSAYISGLNLGYVLNPDAHYRLDLTAVPRFLGYKEQNSTSLEGLDDTEYSIHGGLSLSTTAGQVALNAQLLTDLLGLSGGTEIIGTASRTFAIGDLSLTPSASLNWQDSALVDYYYGIDADEATEERSAYSAEGSISAALSLTAGYPISHSFSVVSTVRYDRYGAEIEDSPIVNNNESMAISTGLIFLF